MTAIVLTALNARYIHSAFGLRYLLANLGELRPQAKLVEFSINDRTTDILESIVAEDPKIVGIGVYIWNVEGATKLVSALKRLRPAITVVIGGPEVSYESEEQEIVKTADYLITGEADLAFAALCKAVLEGQPPHEKIIRPPLPPIEAIQLPYEEYTEEDVQHRVVYLEASRGCPFRCEFCLSSLDLPVRKFPLEPFLASVGRLLERGVKQFKFVDRTFNLNVAISRAILEFFLKRYQPGIFLHFEMVPDRFPEELRDLIILFPPGSLQFEVGIQTFDPGVAALISRRQNYEKLEENLTYLHTHTKVHVHADLIIGLPGEDADSFGRGFDRLVALRPQEIQVGILKRLRGTPIIRHDHEWKMIYSADPPYEILETKRIDFPMMQRLRRLARFWDLYGNSGNFVESLPLLWKDGSPYQTFLAFCDALYEEEKRTHQIALEVLSERLFLYLTRVRGEKPDLLAPLLWRDYQRGGRSRRPAFLKPYGLEEAPSVTFNTPLETPGIRQKRHLRPDGTSSET